MNLVSPVKSSLGPAESFVSRPHQLLVDGQWVDAQSGETFETLNPATEDVITSVALGAAADIDLAVAAARRAFDEGPWPRMLPAERQRILQRLGDLIEANGEELAWIESLDNGKPVSVARVADVPLTADLFHYMAAHARTREGHVVPTSDFAIPGADFHAYSVEEPVGVVGLITPWNYPLLIAAGWQMAGALAAGNTIVLKPSEVTPLSIIRFGELALEAGVPSGVINIVQGLGGSAGARLVEHPQVDKIGFTGSTRTGRGLLKSVADSNLKKVTLELGGKSPDIIFADADLEAAIAGVAMGVFFNQGECCCAGTRVFVEDRIYDEVVEGMVSEAKKIRLGAGQDPDTDMGPLVSRNQLDTVMSYIDAGRSDGATVAVGGDRAGDRGYFVQPTLFADVDPKMSIVREEIFGPVASIERFSDVDDVIKRANDTEYGLGAGIWTTDVSKTHQISRAIRAGTVFVNCYNVFDAAMPFGGYKQSGWGRNRGRQAFEAFTETKATYVKLN